MKAVTITGDVIASSRLRPLQRKKLQNRIDQFAQSFAKQYPDLQLQQYRGDSLQATLTKSRIHAMNIALQLQCFLIAEQYHIRLSIGVGEINFQGKDVITSDGTAFQVSGPLIDELKKRNELIAVTGTDNAFAAEWRLSPAQAEALYLHLQNMKQEDIAKALKISQPSVHQRLQAAGAQVFTTIIKRFESTVSLL